MKRVTHRYFYLGLPTELGHRPMHMKIYPRIILLVAKKIFLVNQINLNNSRKIDLMTIARFIPPCTVGRPISTISLAASRYNLKYCRVRNWVRRTKSRNKKLCSDGYGPPKVIDSISKEECRKKLVAAKIPTAEGIRPLTTLEAFVMFNDAALATKKRRIIDPELATVEDSLMKSLDIRTVKIKKDMKNVKVSL